MLAEVIAIGDELVSGQRLDTNSPWLSQRLGELGIHTAFHASVGDTLATGVDAFRQAAQRADVVICTGGLGPTADDLTRECLAEVLGVELALDPAVLQHIEQLFSRRHRSMPDRNRRQAMFPVGSRVIPNPHGTAPGIDLELPRTAATACRLFALPGVPAEMREMWQDSVAPALHQLLPDGPRTIRHRTLKCFGVGESDLEAMLPDLIQRGREPSVGITVHRATISLRITARGADEADCARQIEPVVATIHNSLGHLVFGEEHQELQDTIVSGLRASAQTLAVCEWGTGGRLAQWLRGADPDGHVFAGATIVNSHAMLSRMLRREPATGVSDRDTAEAMAIHAREALQSDFGLAMGPFVDDHFHFAIATPHETMIEQGHLLGHPDIVADRAAKQLLNSLRLRLR